MDTVRCTIPFPARLERQARIVAAHEGVSKSEIIRRALVAYLHGLETPKLIVENRGQDGSHNER